MPYSGKVKYLEGLNEAQNRAVLATEGAVSVLAGAGSGKTRVLATRIYHLIRQGVPGNSILAVTFTNKAAREMRERVRAMLGEPTSPEDAQGATPLDLPFIATFHGLGRELLERYGRAIGLPRYFSIYDRDDSERVIAKALKALDVESKELSPRAVLSRISKAKGEGMTAIEFREKLGRTSFGNRIAGEAWLRYERTLKEEKALDFDDLIALPVRMLREHEDVRLLAQARWQYIHIDEYQDTNALQAELANMLAAKQRNIFVVGDIDQCLAAGTKILMADGSEKNIERIKENEEVLSNYGGGDMRPARVTRAICRRTLEPFVQITTRAGHTLLSTPEHMHFAGYRLGHTPQMYFTYLMHKHGKGWRIGVSQTYTKGQRASMIGFQQRCNQEHGDEVWVLEAHATPQAARVAEYRLSLTYGIPTLPFVARKGGAMGGYIHDQVVIDSIFASFDTEHAAAALLADKGLLEEYPHHRAQSMTGYRRNVSITLCADCRGMTAMHRIALVCRDAEAARILRDAGFSIRKAKNGSASWRFESVYKDFGIAARMAERIATLLPGTKIVQFARMGGHKKNLKDGNSLPFLPAASIVPGMAMFDGEGRWDIVEKTVRVPNKKQCVYDLDIEHTHNFVANGIVTHNCIYTWRGATIENLLEFDKTYPEAETIILEHNYRSTKTIVEAANAVIEENKNRKEKRSVTDNPAGEKILLHMAPNAEMEALWIARTIQKLIRARERPEEIAILFRTNFQSRALEEGLLRAGVPYKLLGTRYFERKEVKDTLAWVRLALDPTREAEKVRAAASPPRGIGKVTLAKLAAGQRADLRAGELLKVEAFERVIAELALACETLRPSELVRIVVEKSGIAKLGEGNDDERERFENVQELATLAARHDHTVGREGVAAFLAEAALTSDQDELDRKEEQRGVTLMTVHAAKGLEFDTVFVTGMEEGLFPHQGMGGDSDRDEEEERRLFYVAMTRARKRLVLTTAYIRKIYGQDTVSEPSSFLRDISPIHLAYDEGMPASLADEDIIEA